MSSLPHAIVLIACVGSGACATDDTAVGTPDATPPPDATTLDGAGNDATVTDVTTSDVGDERSDAGDASLPPVTAFDASGFAEAGFDSAAAFACVATGGAIVTLPCCLQSGDFPDTCRVGACSCSPAFSAPSAVCQCPSGQCWGASELACLTWDGGRSPP